jgi:predicted phage terminase large subunit-like protein
MNMVLSDLNRLLEAGRRIKDIQEAERLEASFYEFFKAAWPWFDTAELVDNWHLKDICDHMEAVARGYITRGLINEPPRTGKTAIISICFCAWIWAQREKGPLLGPQVSFFYASYAEELSLDHSVKCAALIGSRWYQRLWGDRFKLTRTTRGHIQNDKGGYRMASSVDAKVTGYGADIVIADDPHLVKEAESQNVREDTVKWWSESMPSRLNNRRTGAMIVVMQRVHEGDLSGDILAKDEEARKRGREPNYVHFCVPMSYVPCSHVNAWVDEGGMPCAAEDGVRIVTFIGDDADAIPDEAIFWIDARTEEGELLWPGRFPANDVARLEMELGPYAYAGQYQQTPAPRGGGLIKEEWWQTFDKKAIDKLDLPVPLDDNGEPAQYPPFEFILASLDTAYTEKEENDPSALSIWGIFRDKGGNPKVMLMFCWSERMQIHKLVTRVGEDCKRYKVDRLLIEDKAAGHSVAQELARLFGQWDFGIQMTNPSQGFIKTPDKTARLLTVVHLFAEGLIYAPNKEWADPMIRQCALVPRAVHDDLADTCSMALIYLRRAGWILKKEERQLELEDETRYRPRAHAPLYPV